MIAARVIGSIWATRKDPRLSGVKFMLVERIDEKGSNKRFIAADFMGVGIGERVIIATGSAARRELGNDDIPVDAAVIGIIDEDSPEI